jgi:spore germination cell wall hydrolase CwlJ-like protein
MIPQPYSDLSDSELMALCCYREARGEGILGQRGVCHVIKNRADHPSWWGSSILTVVTHPFQFSSFNDGDPNSGLWPKDTDPVWCDILTIAENVIDGTDEDLTGGCNSYYDVSIPPPRWAGTDPGLAIGRLRCYKL